MRACASQFGTGLRYLGTYELAEDAARAFDQVARVLGRRQSLNFPESEALEINGPRSNGSEELVVVALELARKFVADGGEVRSRSSVYTGVSKTRKDFPWKAQIYVSSTNGQRRISTRAHTHTHTDTHLTHMPARVQFNHKKWNLGHFKVEKDAA